jgi:hypothetical protein
VGALEEVEFGARGSLLLRLVSEIKVHCVRATRGGGVGGGEGLEVSDEKNGNRMGIWEMGIRKRGMEM